MGHAEARVRGEPVVHIGREGLVVPLGHEALLVQERQNARRLRFDEGDAAHHHESTRKKKKEVLLSLSFCCS